MLRRRGSIGIVEHKGENVHCVVDLVIEQPSVTKSFPPPFFLSLVDRVPKLLGLQYIIQTELVGLCGVTLLQLVFPLETATADFFLHG